MCFSKNASIASFSIGMIGALLCVSLGSITDKILGYFLGYVALMQGIEYLLWSHPKCDDYNRTISIMGMLLNNMQPVVFGLIVLLFNSKIRHIKFFYFIIVLYLCVGIPYSLSFININNKRAQCTIKNKVTTHLNWNWNIMNYYQLVYIIFIIAFCIISILGLPNSRHGYIFAFCILFSYISSALIYSNNVGAIWCYYTAFAPMLYYIMRITYFK
jgi:hypothetical protein